MWRWYRRDFSSLTILDGIGSLITIIIAALAYSKHPNWVYGLGGTFVILLFARAFLTFKRKGSEYHTERQTICRFLHYMNRNMFGGAAGHRFTLFTIDPVNPSYIVPYVRFEVGGTDGVTDAEKSKARYQKGVGYTGRAWAKSKSYISFVFPEFKNRSSFEHYYIHELGIPEEIVHDISDYMEKVRHIFCYGLVDSQDRFLGVLSLDSLSVWGSEPKDMPTLAELLALLGLLLESFSRSHLR